MANVDPPHEVSADGGTGWLLPGHDYANSRDAVGSTLRASTIDRLTMAWSIPTAGALTTAALIVGNTVYAEDDHGVVVAANKKTGRTLWQSVSTGFTVGPEGVAVGWGKVFAATADGIEALDARSGHVLWTRRLTQSPTAGVDMQPTVIGHRVLIATVPVSAAVRYQGGDRVFCSRSTPPQGKSTGHSTRSRPKTSGDIPASTPGAAPGTRLRSTREPESSTGEPPIRPRFLARPNIRTDRVVPARTCTPTRRWHLASPPVD